MENNKKYLVTIDGVDFSGKSTLWKKISPDKNVQIRGILSNIAYGLKYNRDIDKMIEEYNKIPLNYIIYFLNPSRKTLIRNFNSRLLELVCDSEQLSKEAKSFADTIGDYKYFVKAYDILKEKYNGDIIFAQYDDNSLESFNEFVERYTLYTKAQLKNQLMFEETKDIIILKSTIDEFEYKAKVASEYTKIVFIDSISEEDIIDTLCDEVDDKYKHMIDFLVNEAGRSKKDIYELFKDSSDNLEADDLTYFLDNYEVNIDADVSCNLETHIRIYVSLSTLASYDSMSDYLYEEELETITNELEYSLRDTVYEIDNVEVS